MLTRRFMISIVLLGLAAAGLTSCGKSEERHAAAAKSAVRVRTLVMDRTAEPARLELSGELVAESRIEVASKIAGHIAELPVTEGTRVQKGQLLARLDAPELVSAHSQAVAAEQAARLEMETAARQAERFRRLVQSQVVTQRDLELAELGEAGAKASYERARSVAEMARRNLSYAELRAPADGVVVRRSVRPGDLATPGRPILVLEDPEMLEVRITLPAGTDWPVTAGDRAEVRLGSGTTHPATVDRVAPAADRHTVEAYLRVDGVAARSGTFVRATLFGSGTVDAIRVPEASLLRRGPLTGVFVVREGHATLRWLRLAADGRVLAGLEPGDVVVSAPPADLEDGDPVEVIQ